MLDKSCWGRGKVLNQSTLRLWEETLPCFIDISNCANFVVQKYNKLFNNHQAFLNRPFSGFQVNEGICHWFESIPCPRSSGFPFSAEEGCGITSCECVKEKWAGIWRKYFLCQMSAIVFFAFSEKWMSRITTPMSAVLIDIFIWPFLIQDASCKTNRCQPLLGCSHPSRTRTQMVLRWWFKLSWYIVIKTFPKYSLQTRYLEREMNRSSLFLSFLKKLFQILGSYTWDITQNLWPNPRIRLAKDFRLLGKISNNINLLNKSHSSNDFTDEMWSACLWMCERFVGTEPEREMPH